MIEREVIKKIIPWIGKKKILILKGSRQVGKTTLLAVIKNEILKKDKSARVAYLLADDIDNKPIFSSPAALEAYLKQLYDFPDQPIYLCLDEFQAIKDAGLFLKNLSDKYQGKLRIIASGSSSLEITKNSEFLTGRAISFDITRVSFKEFFNYSKKTEVKTLAARKLNEAADFYQAFAGELNILFSEYMVFGGYPEVITTKKKEEKKIVLDSIVKTYIEKDVINFLKIENITAFNNLLKILADQIGNLVNAHELSNTLNISINTLNKYLEILQGTYLFNLARPFSTNRRSEISKMPKIFILDLGLRNYLLRNFEANDMVKGSLAENFVYLALLEKFAKEQINYYRTITGSEIDFIVDLGLEKIIFEVKYASKAKEPLAFRNYSEKYNKHKIKKIIITRDLLKKERGVLYLPAVMLPFVKF